MIRHKKIIMLARPPAMTEIWISKLVLSQYLILVFNQFLIMINFLLWLQINIKRHMKDSFRNKTMIIVFLLMGKGAHQILPMCVAILSLCGIKAFS